MKQLTLRGFGPELQGRLEEIARDRSISLNRAALLLMRRGAGLAPPEVHSGEPHTIGAALDKFVGVWSEQEEREFLQSIEHLDRIDSALWE